jgi:hypothetical protein
MPHSLIIHESPNMFNITATANGKLDVPITRQRSVQFYSDLPKHAYDQRIRIEADWFHEFFIAQLIDRGETALLSLLFRVLSPQHLSNLNAWFLKNRSVWLRSLVDIETGLIDGQSYVA